MVSEMTFFETWDADRQKMKEQAPEVVRIFGAFHKGIMSEGALSVREKELIALGIGLAQRCESCVHLHVRGSLKAGATRQQVLEAASVAVLMQGGPAFTHMPVVLSALELVQAESTDASAGHPAPPK